MTEPFAAALQPEPPPLLPSTWAPLAGWIGAQDADFRVDEIPLYALSGEGEHLFLHIEKQGLNTRDIVKQLSQLSGVSQRDIGYAGMKDRHAITTQWFSLATPEDPSEWAWGDGVRLLAAERHTNKLRTGHLEGNRFRIRLVGLDDASALASRVEALRATGVLNGFDAQRFGYGGQNLPRALEWAERGGRLSRFKQKLYTSVLQSQVFNQILRTRSEAGQLHVLAGDVLRLDGSQSVFVSEDSAADEARRQEGDVHLTGPIFGPRARAADGPAFEIEEAAIRALGLSEKAFKLLGKNGRGTRRDLLLKVPDLSLEIENEQQAVLSFSLASGAYATNVIRHVLRRGWDAPLRHELPKEGA